MGRYMADNGQDLVKALEATGFFEQLGTVQSSLSQLAQDIAAIGDQATQRLDEMESIAAHVMAIEAVLAVMMKSHPVDGDAVRAEVTARTADLSGNPDGSPTVQAVAQDLLKHV